MIVFPTFSYRRNDCQVCGRTFRSEKVNRKPGDIKVYTIGRRTIIAHAGKNRCLGCGRKKIQGRAPKKLKNKGSGTPLSSDGFYTIFRNSLKKQKFDEK